MGAVRDAVIRESSSADWAICDGARRLLRHWCSLFVTTAVSFEDLVRLPWRVRYLRSCHRQPENGCPGRVIIVEALC
jgi:hypothetical protein